MLLCVRSRGNPSCRFRPCQFSLNCSPRPSLHPLPIVLSRCFGGPEDDKIGLMKLREFVSQGKYIKDMLKKFGMDDVKAISTPMGTNRSLDSDASGNMVDQKIYRSMIGSLLYVTASRPDVMFSVCMCARF